ncbi:MAG: hypothetical protein DSY37_03185 [Hyperthermus sp.]|nr:MAG: hypothetical protein DSY37_03185 [Hyperthermus sp.]
MRKVTVYIHPTCLASYRLIKHLHSRGLLERVEVVSTANSMQHVLANRVWSVPWIVVDGEPAATDPVEPLEAEAIITGAWSPTSSKGVEEAFMEAVLHSAYASSIAYVHDGLEAVVDPLLVSAAVRAPLRKVMVEDVVDRLRAKSRELWEAWRDKIMRALGISFVREYWWARGGRLEADELRSSVNTAVIGLWLIAKASLGRSGLPSNPVPRRELVEKLARFVLRGAAGLVARVEREQNTILADSEYWRLLGSLGIE